MATSLVKRYLNAHGITDLKHYFQEDNWELFEYAVEFRNVLVHECTYLGIRPAPCLSFELAAEFDFETALIFVDAR